MPASWLTEDEQGPDETESPVLGAYASTYRRSTTVLREEDHDDDKEVPDVTSEQSEERRRGQGKWVQVQRLANPLVNEVIIATEHKDRWNATDPWRERRFVRYYDNPHGYRLGNGLWCGC